MYNGMTQIYPLPVNIELCRNDIIGAKCDPDQAGTGIAVISLKYSQHEAVL
jgi:hypothetical protein